MPFDVTALYGLSIGVFCAPGDFASYIDVVKAWQLSPALLFPAKTIIAFPLVYHYVNGIRHLVSLSRMCRPDILIVAHLANH